MKYGNEHVDASRTHLNNVLCFRDAPQRETAAEELARLRARVEEIDAAEPPKRIRRDRVTLVSIEVPVPAGLLPEQENAFFQAAFSAIARFCGGSQNCGQIRVHRDEVHEYMDPVTREHKTSRVHAHMIGIPYVKGRGVNCKAFMSRDRLRQIQQDVDNQCRQKLGIQFLDGSRQRSRGTVEDLKLASARVEQEQRVLESLREQQQEAAKSLQETLEARDAIQDAITALEAKQECLEASVRDLERVLPVMQHVDVACRILDDMDPDKAYEFWSELRAYGIDPERNPEYLAHTVNDLDLER